MALCHVIVGQDEDSMKVSSQEEESEVGSQ